MQSDQLSSVDSLAEHLLKTLETIESAALRLAVCLFF